MNLIVRTIVSPRTRRLAPAALAGGSQAPIAIPCNAAAPPVDALEEQHGIATALRPHRDPFRPPASLRAPPAQQWARIQSVDFVRVVAVFAVILIHIAPFTHDHVQVGIVFNPGVLLNQIARFAVPFFFIISGFFWAAQLERHDTLLQPTLRMAKRIAWLFLCWSAFYLLPTNISESMHGGTLGPITTFMSNLRQAGAHPGKVFFEGTKVHLWFLISLLWSLAISALLISKKLPRTLILASIALYIIGLSGKAYSDTPLGFHSGFNFRDGPFFGLIFFVSGYFMQRRGPRPSWLIYGIVLMIVGFAVHFTELIMLKHFWGSSTMQDYLLGTYLIGMGVAMSAFANPRFLRFPRLSAIGPLVAGIYVIHFACIELLQPLDELLGERFWWGIAYPVSVFMLSLAAVAALSRTRWAWLVR